MSRTRLVSLLALACLFAPTSVQSQCDPPAPVAGPGGPGTGGGPGFQPTLPPGAGPRKFGPTTPLGFASQTKIGWTALRGGFYPWEVWWEFNRSEFIRYDARYEPKADDEVDPQYAGRASDYAEHRLDTISATIVPTLNTALADTDFKVVESAVLALGRITPAEDADEILPGIAQTLRHKNREVRQAAVLALGSLGHPDAIPLLLGILDDTSVGRKALHSKGEIDEVTRAFAAVALGTTADPAALESLMKHAKRAKDSDVELKSSCLLALGMFPDQSKEVVPFLLDLLSDRRMNDVSRAQVPIALSRLGTSAESAVPTLLKFVKDKKTRNLLKASCVIALGRIAAGEDDDVIAALLAALGGGADWDSRNFALIALGQIGGRAAADPIANEKRLDRIARTLLKLVAKPKRHEQRPWACLAAGILGRGYPEESEGRQLIARKLMEAFEERGIQQTHQAPMALALGIMHAAEAGPMLLAAFDDDAEAAHRCYLALGLGMLEHVDARESLRRELSGGNRPAIRYHCATALGLMSDRWLVDFMSESLATSGTLYALAPIARTMGLVRRPETVEVLTDTAGDRSANRASRALACMALGYLAKKRPEPWNTPLAIGSNYLATFEAQERVMDLY